MDESIGIIIADTFSLYSKTAILKETQNLLSKYERIYGFQNKSIDKKTLVDTISHECDQKLTLESFTSFYNEYCDTKITVDGAEINKYRHASSWSVIKFLKLASSLHKCEFCLSIQ